MSETTPAPDLSAIGNVQEIETVEVAELVATAAKYLEKKLRFITAACLDQGESFEVLYFFDDALRTLALRTILPKGQPLPTLTPVYLCTFLVENEMQDLFGIVVEGLDIDYKGKFLVTDQFDVPPLLKDVACEVKGVKQ